MFFPPPRCRLPFVLAVVALWLIQLEPLAAPRAEALVGEADAERRVVAPDMAAVRAGDDEAIARGPARPPPPDHLHEAGPAGMPPDERQRLDRIRPLGLG